MEKTIIYRPYRSYIVFAYVMLGLSVIALMIAGATLRASQNREAIIFIGVSCSGMILTHILYATSKIMIVLDMDGLRIINDRKIRYCFVSWREISYGYCARNYKGYMFLILSADKLGEEQIKKLANKAGIKVCFDNVFVIALDTLQDTSEIKNMVKKNIVSMIDEPI